MSAGSSATLLRLARLRTSRPLLVPAALAVGLASSLAVRPAFSAAAVVGAAAAAAAIVGSRARLTLIAVALVAAGSAFGGVRLAAQEQSVLTELVGRAVDVRVEVTAPFRPAQFATRVPVLVTRADGRAVREPAQLELPPGARPARGTILELVAVVRSPRRAERPGEFDEASYLARRGIHVVLRGDWFRAVGRRDGLPGLADRVRARLAATIAPGLEGERRALVAGVVLGEDEGLDDELRDRFRASGLYHLLAVSGQNVAYVVVGVLLLAWLAGLGRGWGHVAALGAVAAYVAAVGWQPSVVRAGVAGGLASLAWLSGRAADRWYFMLVGACVLLAWSPTSLLDPGFQLSFAAVAAIFLLVPRLERRLGAAGVPRVVTVVLAVSLACGVVTAPVLWLHFGAVPVLSVLANAIAAPVVAPILGLGLASAAIQPVLPAAASALAWANGWLVAWLAWCARTVGGLPFAQVTSLPLLVAIAAALGWLVAVLHAHGALRRWLLLGGVVCALGAGWWALSTGGAPIAPPEGLRISFLDVGQGDAALLEVPEGAVLVDQGPPEGEVARQLQALGVRSLAALVLTHPQRDHIGGAGEVLRRLDVGAVLDPGLPNDSEDEQRALEAAARREVPIVLARAGQVYRLGRLRLEVMWPDAPGQPGEDPNRRAIVLLASYGEVDALLTADAESEVTGTLPLRAVEILKVAHHGSADTGLPALLRRLRPRIAVISVGSGNDYGHPTASTLAALAGVPGLRTFRTDRDGRVVVESVDGRSLETAAAR